MALQPNGASALEIYAHRASAGLFPENTIPAIARSLRLGVDRIDLDISISKDKQIIATHDPKPNPEITRDKSGKFLTNNDKYFWEMDYSEIKTFDVGRAKEGSDYAIRFFSQQPIDGAYIPTLKEAIQFVDKLTDGKVKFQIEIKIDANSPVSSPDRREMVTNLIRVLHETNATLRAEVHSFDFASIILLQELEPKITPSYITYSKKEDVLEKVLKWHAGYDVADFDDSFPRLIHKLGGKVWCPGFTDLTIERVREAHELDIKVVPWTVDSPNDMAAMIEMGVDGIITDRPDLLREVMTKYNLPLPKSYS